MNSMVYYCMVGPASLKSARFDHREVKRFRFTWVGTLYPLSQRFYLEAEMLLAVEGGIGGANPDNPEVRAVSSSKYSSVWAVVPRSGRVDGGHSMLM